MHINALEKHAVQTFVVEETQELIFDNDKLDEWKETCQALGLEKQGKLAQPQKSPIPFLVLNAVLTRTFAELCPKKVDIKDYSQSPIPVEILKLVKLGIDEGHFQKVEIWYDDEDLDPVCVGIAGRWYPEDDNWRTHYKDENGISFNFKTKQDALEYQRIKGWKKHSPHFSESASYLIGRWADVARDLNELKQIAKDRYLRRKGAELNKTIKEAQAELAVLEEEAELKFL